jgi:hypothetical protein
MPQLLPGFRRFLECFIQGGDVRRTLDGLGQAGRALGAGGQRPETDRKRESHSGPAKAARDEAGAELLLEAGLRVIGLSEAALARLSKGAAQKVVLA